MNNRNVTLQVIADKAHVSKSLVSRIINNRPVRVSDEKRAQILHIANELDYMPSGEVIKVSPMPKLNKTIALILPNLESKFMSTISDTITRKTVIPSSSLTAGKIIPWNTNTWNFAIHYRFPAS